MSNSIRRYTISKKVTILFFSIIGLCFLIIIMCAIFWNILFGSKKIVRATKIEEGRYYFGYKDNIKNTIYYEKVDKKQYELEQLISHIPIYTFFFMFAILLPYLSCNEYCRYKNNKFGTGSVPFR